MCLQVCVRMEEERRVFGSSRHFRPLHLVRQLLAPVGYQAWLPHPCHSVAAMHAPTACACERNWSVWGQMCTKHCPRLALERARKLIFICCNNKDFSVGDLESSLQLLAE